VAAVSPVSHARLDPATVAVSNPVLTAAARTAAIRRGEGAFPALPVGGSPASVFGHGRAAGAAVLVEEPWLWVSDAHHEGPWERWSLGGVGQVLHVVLEFGEGDWSDAHPGLIRRRLHPVRQFTKVSGVGSPRGGERAHIAKPLP
jgi:hypothetical protein